MPKKLYFCTMLHAKKHTIRRFVRRVGGGIAIVALIYSCASVGRPDGGPIDEKPPRFLSSTPVPGALNYTKKRVTIEFDEFIKLEKPGEKVVISPPQSKQPEIKSVGKRITVNLLDSLKRNTTYTVDFGDAIVDNNEGNPLGDFTFTFSTGEVIDTMQVSGTVLDASNLEPVKGILVGLHSNLTDSAFTKLPFERVGRTDSRGRFRIQGVAPGSYRIFSLMDADQNFAYSQKSEVLAFNDSLIIPHMEGRMRQDTVWLDSLTIDSVSERPYTHYLPDDVILRSFKELSVNQYLIKGERLTPNKFTFYFSAPNDTLPTLEGLNFDQRDAFVIEPTFRKDTIHYWVKDSLLYKQDTLRLSLNYLYTDTLSMLVPRTDTLNLVTKNVPKKEEPKKKKKKDSEEEKPVTKFLGVTPRVPSSMDVYDYISLTVDEPVDSCNVEAFHLRQKVDTVWTDISFEFEQDSLFKRMYNVYYDWEPGGEYEFSVDSLAFKGIYGLHSNKIKQGFKVKKETEYGKITYAVTGADPKAFVELLDNQDKVLRRRRLEDGKVVFYFLNPGKYCARLINDTNGNGIWDTGSYEEKRQPEMVYYYSIIIDVRADWEYNQDWDVTALPLDKQKPDELKKQKPDEKKKRTTQRNNQNRRN